LKPERWSQIEELFHRAAEHETAQRRSLLDQECEGDPQLRREVEALLASDEEAKAALEFAVRMELDSFVFPLIGETVAHFLIMDGLDGGGMGVVYRALDIKLGRTVALKFLPEDSVRDQRALKRFDREARAASALEHPNICPVYELGERHGQPFIVMPLLEGQTLRELISSSNEKNQRLGLSDVLNYAIQVLEGLDVAHRNGLIHRDIKPANIFVTHRGQIKLLDFGLAKLIRSGEDDHDGIAPIAEPYFNLFDPPLSRTGVVIGTVGYMSPEQMRGQVLDARSDLYSFGLVVYEMITGQRALRSGAESSIPDGVFEERSSGFDAVNSAILEQLITILRKALQTNPDERYASASEFRSDIERITPQSKPARWRSRQALASLGILVLVGGAAMYWGLMHSPSAPPVAREFKLRQLTTNSAENHLLNGAISPDGKYLAYTDLKGLHLKRLDDDETRAVALRGQTVEAFNDYPAWFPDSMSFLVNTISRSGNFKEHTPSDSIIWRIFVAGSEPRKLRENAFAWGVSPDGFQIAFGAHDGRLGPREVWLMDPDGGNSRKIFATDEEHAIDPFVWSADGKRLGYIRSGGDGPRGFSMDLEGNPPIANFSSAELSTITGFLLLPDHKAIYSVMEEGAEGTCNFWMATIDPQTLKPVESMRRLTNWTGFCMDPTSATSDGKKIAFVKWTQHRTVYLADLDATGAGIAKSTHFTLDETGSTPVDWTPDGKALVVTSMRNGKQAILRQNLKTDETDLIATAPGRFYDPELSADGKWILWQIGPDLDESSQSHELMRVPVNGGQSDRIAQVRSETTLSCARNPANTCVLAERTEDRRQIVLSSFDPVRGRGAEIMRVEAAADDDWNGRISPDANLFAFITGPSSPIYIRPLRGNRATIVPTKGLNYKRSFRWTANGRGFYVTNAVKGGSELFYVDMHGVPKKLWHNDGDFPPVGVPSPDGRRLAIQGSTLDDNIWLIEDFDGSLSPFHK
jgi:serine/threonine protein kinase